MAIKSVADPFNDRQALNVEFSILEAEAIGNEQLKKDPIVDKPIFFSKEECTKFCCMLRACLCAEGAGISERTKDLDCISTTPRQVGARFYENLAESCHQEMQRSFGLSFRNQSSQNKLFLSVIVGHAVKILDLDKGDISKIQGRMESRMNRAKSNFIREKEERKRHLEELISDFKVLKEREHEIALQLKEMQSFQDCTIVNRNSEEIFQKIKQTKKKIEETQWFLKQEFDKVGVCIVNLRCELDELMKERGKSFDKSIMTEALLGSFFWELKHITETDETQQTSRELKEFILDNTRALVKGIERLEVKYSSLMVVFSNDLEVACTIVKSTLSLLESTLPKIDILQTQQTEMKHINEKFEKLLLEFNEDTSIFQTQMNLRNKLYFAYKKYKTDGVTNLPYIYDEEKNFFLSQNSPTVENDYQIMGGFYEMYTDILEGHLEYLNGNSRAVIDARQEILHAIDRYENAISLTI